MDTSGTYLQNAEALKAVAQELFPEGDVKVDYSGRGRFEINGLKAGTEPQNCQVMLRGQDPRAKERREHFLVRTQNAIAFFRICTAMPGCGYDEFVACRACAFLGTEDAHAVEKLARETIPVLCR